jgi:SAM-dependent methyltransferase
MNTVKKLDYVLGHSQREIQRLISQAAMLRPVTERLLRSLKIGPGMRVLDLGCGAGDVSMLAAEFVGPTGLVVGIDRNREVSSFFEARRERLTAFQMPACKIMPERRLRFATISLTSLVIRFHCLRASVYRKAVNVSVAVRARASISRLVGAWRTRSNSRIWRSAKSAAK